MNIQRSLFIKRFKKNKFGFFSLYIIIFLYTISLFAEIIAPYDPNRYDSKKSESPPNIIRFVDEAGKFHFFPFVYDYKIERNKITLRKEFLEDKHVLNAALFLMNITNLLIKTIILVKPNIL